MPTLLEQPRTLRPPPPFSQAAYCWIPDYPPGRNQFVSFELRVCLVELQPAVMHLFADTRYRLFVNERFVAYGPGRFVTSQPEFDTHDLKRWMQTGANLIRVEVNHYGCASFQTMPDGRPGFIAAGGTADGSISFETPGDWKARIHRAWDANAPHFSFAQNPVEICDTRVLAEELEDAEIRPLRVLPSDEIPWGKPAPRTVPYPDYALRHPARLLAAGPLARCQRWGVQFRHPSFTMDSRGTGLRHVAFVTWIHSPREQTVVMDCFWTDVCLNGTPLSLRYPNNLGNHGETTVDLRDGWNFLAGNLELLLAHWPLLLGFPPDAGVSLHAFPDHDCQEAFVISPPQETRFLHDCPPAPAAFTLPTGWRTAISDLFSVTPSRLVAWDRPDPDHTIRNLSPAEVPEVSTIESPSAFWCFDFSDEYYGHPVIEVDAPAGAILDVSYDDWKRADGFVNLYNSNPFTEATDRFILRGGRQRIEVLNPRGGIFLQLLLRAPEGTQNPRLSVHEIAIRRRTTLVSNGGGFTCGNEMLDWAWRVSVHTLQASTDESYADCPWRERANYIADSFVNLHLHRLISADLSVARRTLALFGQAQLPNGQLACSAPSWLTKPHEDFTLLWIIAVRDFWAFSGDIAFVAAQWPVIKRIFAGSSWKADDEGLWDTTGKRLFIDWGVVVSEREGAANAVINILRVPALRAAAELANALGLPAAAGAYSAEASRVSATVVERLWNHDEGRFNASLGAATPALHANILALRYGVGPAGPLLAYLEPLLRSNLRNGLADDRVNGFSELYFFHYVLPALALHDRAELAETLIDETYGYLKSFGYPTLVESFHKAKQARGSCCHSWSGSAALYATDYILGLRHAHPGNPDAFVLDPRAVRPQGAKGTLPHARGCIQVHWERRAGGIHAHAVLPPGVTLTPAAGVHLTLG
jgi:hypothetical protein